MCPFVVFIYANKFAWCSGMGDGNQGKTKHISMSRQRTGFPISAAKIKNILFTSSAHLLYSRPPLFFQRACRQCVHESARLFRVMCSHAWYSRDCAERKIADFRSAICRTHLPRMARATNSCTPHGGSEGGRRESSLLTFGILRLGDAVQRWLRHPEPSSWSYKSTIKEKVT